MQFFLKTKSHMNFAYDYDSKELAPQQGRAPCILIHQTSLLCTKITLIQSRRLTAGA